LVIPDRWTESQDIKQAIEYREAKTSILGNYNFEKAEDRTARAKVQILKIELAEEKEDAFDRFFNEEFKHLKEKFSDKDEDEKATTKEDKEKFSSLILGKNYVQNLVALYDSEIKNIRNNYDLVGKLDVSLLREFDIHPDTIKKCLKERLKGLKNLYWKELVSRMSEITDKLTSKKREDLLKTAQENAHVDFTESNVYAVILWILKNASCSIDEQLIQVFEKMLSEANVKRYKSNQRPFLKDQWRYNEQKPSHISLEYRLVLQYYGRIERNYSKGYSLSESANNFGFHCSTTDDRLYRYNNDNWKPGGVQEFFFVKDNKRQVLLEVRAHLNGNLHVRMNQKYALALNVEYGRLKGWLKNAAEAVDELQDTGAVEFFKINTLLPSATFTQLFYTPEPKQEPIKETKQPTQTEQLCLYL
jgi:hypothetical protein